MSAEWRKPTQPLTVAVAFWRRLATAGIFFLIALTAILVGADFCRLLAAASADFCKRTTEDDILLLSENGCWDFFKRQISKASESFAIHIVHFLLCSILISLCSHIFSNFWKHRTWLSSHNQESGGGGDHQHINVTSLRVLLTPLKARTLMIWGEPEGKMRAGANEDLWSYSPDISHMVPQKSSAFSTFA